MKIPELGAEFPTPKDTGANAYATKVILALTPDVPGFHTFTTGDLGKMLEDAFDAGNDNAVAKVMAMLDDDK